MKDDEANEAGTETLRSLKESEALFRTLYNNLPGGMVVIGKDYRIKNVNQRTCDITGYSRDELVGELCDIICPKGSESKKCPIWEDGQEGFEGMDTFVKTRDGRMNSILKNARRVMVNGEEHILEVFQDTRRQKENEQALRESEARMSSIFRAAPIGVGTSFNERIDSINERFCEITGYAPEDIIGRSPEILFESKEKFAGMRRDDLGNLNDQNSITREVRCRRKDGNVIDILLSLARFENENNEMGVTFALLDISDRKKADAEREKLREHYYQAMKMESVGRLAGGIAHDLNNLLTPILGYSELLLLDGIPKMQHLTGFSAHDNEDDPLESAREIARAAKKAKDLVQQLLAFSRKQTLRFSRIDLNELITRFEQLLRRTIREDIAIEMHLFPGELVSEGDFSQLEQVVMNLVVNAQDAMPDGGVLSIETGVMALSKSNISSDDEIDPGWYNVLTIRDTGHGMDKETVQNIFEPFFTTKSLDKGTGLGLATVYGIIKQHKGTITVESSPGEGACFKIFLPVAEPVEERQASPRAATGIRGNETILLAEDNSQVRRLVCSTLKQHGYEVIDAPDGIDALEKMKAFGKPVDLLVTDVVMPKISGRQLHEAVEKIQPGVPVLFMSGHSDEVLAQRGIVDSDINYLQKPFSITELTEKICAVLEDSK
ncbi:MAG: PAS domain S-box protein [Pontiellaceae bacterium]|nr:PAS domain S-box protein [Pontiellaceae bacterium]